MLGMLRDLGAFLINYLLNVLFLDFLFPILFNYNQPLQEWHFTPLSNGEGRAAQRRGGGAFPIPPSHSLPGSHSPPYSFVPSQPRATR